MTSKSVLLVEDEEIIRTLCRRLLSGLGFTLTLAGSVAEAVQFIDGNSLDLLITDVRLPDGYGLEVIRSLRRKNETIPVLVITGSPGSQAKEEELAQLQIVRRLAKPFDVGVFQKAVRDALQK